jgi:hypothetical protein
MIDIDLFHHALDTNYWSKDIVESHSDDDFDLSLDDQFMYDMSTPASSPSPVQIDDSLTLDDLRLDNNFDDPHDAFQAIYQNLYEQKKQQKDDGKSEVKKKKQKKVIHPGGKRVRYYDPFLMNEAKVTNTFEKIFLCEGNLLELRFIVQNNTLKVQAGDLMSLFINRQNVSREIFSITGTNDPVYKTFMNMHWVPVSFLEQWIVRKRKISQFMGVYKQVIRFMKKDGKMRK